MATDDTDTPKEQDSMLSCALLLPEDASPEGLTCEFSCCALKTVPATYDPEAGVVTCQPPCAEKSGVKFVVKDAGGSILLEDDLGDDKESIASVTGSQDESSKRVKESKADYMKREFSALKPFVIISSSYLLFTITDGALRMIVLLHAYSLGFSAFETAVLFTLYELAGVVTNLSAGLMGARWGIRATLLTGLSLQVVGIGLLMGWQDIWGLPENRWKGMIYVIFAQMWAGIAKDLTKLGGKTVAKLVTPDEKQSRLFKLVSFITGFKNTLKGFGYFLGSALLSVNYFLALGVMMGLVILAMPWAIFGLSSELGQTRKDNISLSTIIKQSQQINWLSAARFFLFGSRDLWFEVPLPYFLRDTLLGVGLTRTQVGTYLALWIIVYGQVQSWSPQLALSPLKQGPPYTTNKFVGALWAGVLMVCPLYMSILMLGTDIFYPPSEFGVKLGTMTAGLVAFCLIFAINSSVHSYLVVRYSEGNKVAMNVGFYYMANAAGRLTGTILSGAIYTYAGGLFTYVVPSADECAGDVSTAISGGVMCTVSDITQGFGFCFVASCVFVLASTLLMFPIKDNKGGFRCGAFSFCGAGDADAEEDANHSPADPKTKPLQAASSPSAEMVAAGVNATAPKDSI